MTNKNIKAKIKYTGALDKVHVSSRRNRMTLRKDEEKECSLEFANAFSKEKDFEVTIIEPKKIKSSKKVEVTE
jgi:hypothetical protein